MSSIKEIAALPPVILLENEHPMDALQNAIFVGNTQTSERRLSHGLYEDIPFQKDPSLLRHKYSLDISDEEQVLTVKPLPGNKINAGVRTEEGDSLEGEVIIYFGNTKEINQRRMVGIISQMDNGDTFLHSILLLENP